MKNSLQQKWNDVVARLPAAFVDTSAEKVRRSQDLHLIHVEDSTSTKDPCDEQQTQLPWPRVTRGLC